MGEKEDRIRRIVKFYYSKPEVQEAILSFSLDREVVPSYMAESFGKRPDSLQYRSDIMGLVEKGATSFHTSEEIWENPREINLDMDRDDLDSLRKGWDLLIDVDSPFLDCSKIATGLLISALEYHGIRKYGIKFSGSKGFHIIVSGKAFPQEFQGEKGKNMFPEWPRAICRYLMSYIRRDYNLKVGEILRIEDIEKRTGLTKEDLTGFNCINCGARAKKGSIVKLECGLCSLRAERRNVKLTKRRLKCLNNDCAGILEVVGEDDYYYCENCKDPESEKLPLGNNKYPESFEEVKGVSAEKIASLDLVLVAPRHLFRAPYSLHEKTALASIVLEKGELSGFTPRDADPMNVKIRNFMPENEEGEGRELLASALDWSKTQKAGEDDIEKKKYKKFEKIDASGVNEGMFPPVIKKLLLGLKGDGKKRGLFVLITFLRSLGFSGEYINSKIREWNKKNAPTLKEGYVKSQIDWHLRQKKQILPPNYANDSFYKDIGLLEAGKEPKTKNPIVDVLRELRRKRGN